MGLSLSAGKFATTGTAIKGHRIGAHVCMLALAVVRNQHIKGSVQHMHWSSQIHVPTPASPRHNVGTISCTTHQWFTMKYGTTYILTSQPTPYNLAMPTRPAITTARACKEEDGAGFYFNRLCKVATAASEPGGWPCQGTCLLQFRLIPATSCTVDQDGTFEATLSDLRVGNLFKSHHDASRLTFNDQGQKAPQASVS
eukprot:scaffold15415_cov26-Tisochrysis_lutea.AAC.1